MLKNLNITSPRLLGCMIVHTVIQFAHYQLHQLPFLHDSTESKLLIGLMIAALFVFTGIDHVTQIPSAGKKITKVLIALNWLSVIVIAVIVLSTPWTFVKVYGDMHGDFATLEATVNPILKYLFNFYFFLLFAFILATPRSTIWGPRVLLNSIPFLVWIMTLLMLIFFAEDPYIMDDEYI